MIPLSAGSDRRHLDRRGVRIAYGVHGQATERIPLLLSHGYGASSEMWRPNLASLAARRQVVTWDLRGHGDSASPGRVSQYAEAECIADMVAILAACDMRRAAVGGLSLGGYLSLALQLDHPDRVAALLLFDTGPGFRRDDVRARWNASAEAQAARFERHGLDALPDGPEVGSGPHDPAGLALAARGTLVQHSSRVIDALSSISVPTLVLVGANDVAFLAAADHMARRIPNATKVVVPRAGHASNIDRPSLFNEAVNLFLDDVDDRRRSAVRS